MRSILINAAFLSIIFHTISYSQKNFEGKIVSEITWENVPEKMKAYYKTSTCTIYYKKDKTRSESAASNYTAVTSEDYITGKRLMLMDINIGSVNQKTATLSEINNTALQSFTIEKTGEFKTINNYNCEKIITISVVNGKKVLGTSFVNNDYIINAGLLSSGPIYMNLPMETSTDLGESGTMILKTISISEEPLSDDLFNLSIPKGYKLNDMTTASNKAIINNYNSIAAEKNKNEVTIQPTTLIKNNQPTQTTVIDKYANLSDAELKKQLDEAVAKEDYDKAQALKIEIDKRKKKSVTKYSGFPDATLTKMLKEAVDKEDYVAAEEIKKEMDNRKVSK